MPLSLEGQQMFLQAWAARNRKNPTFSPSFLTNGNLLGSGNGQSCTTTTYNPSNMPNNQIQLDPLTGVLTWSIAPDRLDSNYAVQLRRINVRTLSNSVGTVTIIPYAGQIDGQTVQLNSVSGQANTDILFNYDANIILFFITMSPSYFSGPIDPNQISVDVDYCVAVQNIQPYYTQNGIGTPLNQQPGMFTLAFLRFFLN
jgi:hypothetical protein